METALPEGVRVWSVTDITRAARGLLEEAFPDVWVEGEVSNPKTYPSGHTYFDLKDEDAVVAAVLFAARFGPARDLPFRLEQGLRVLVRARLSSYAKSSKIQLIVSRVEPRAMGALQLAFEQLKKRLEAEGLFAPGRKRPIPAYPERVGVVTSSAGAALRDVLSVLGRRAPDIGVVVHPVRVQGDGAAGEIAAAIAALNREVPDLDVLIVGRGGGSLEDLWAFNEEAVARAIAASRIPVISAVGHETDFTIADFVADLRAPTPSAAAELVARHRGEVRGEVRRLEASLVAALRGRLTRAEAAVASLLDRRVFRRPMSLYEDRARDADELQRRLLASLEAPVTRAEGRVAALAGKLDALSPLAVLGRGYAIAFRRRDGRAVRRAADVKAGDGLRVRVHEGEFLAEVKDA